MNFPEDLRYTKSHEWVKLEEDGRALVGLSDYAQDALGDLVFVNLPQEGDEVQAGEVFADVESVKAVSDVYSPVSGRVAKVNEELLDAPESINQNPYEAWFVQIEDVTDQADLMSAGEYEEYVKNLDE